MVNTDFSTLKHLRAEGKLTDDIVKVLEDNLTNYNAYYFNERKNAKR